MTRGKKSRIWYDRAIARRDALAAGTKQESENGKKTPAENGGFPPEQLNVKV